jgi:hypothetical protein
VDLRGERRVLSLTQGPRTDGRHEATPAMWQETYLSAILRAIRYADDASYRLAGYRKLDPITTIEAESRFLKAAEELFFQGKFSDLIHEFTELDVGVNINDVRRLTRQAGSSVPTPKFRLLLMLRITLLLLLSSISRILSVWDELRICLKRWQKESRRSPRFLLGAISG